MRERWPLSAVAQVESYKGTGLRYVRCVRAALARISWRAHVVSGCDLRSARRRCRNHPRRAQVDRPVQLEDRCRELQRRQLSRAAGDHRSAMSAGFSVRRVQPSDINRFHLYFNNGHCVMARKPDDVSNASQVAAYEQEGRSQVRERLGPRIDRVRPGIATVFPNFAVLRGTANSMRVWHPRGPDPHRDLVVDLCRPGRAARSQRGDSSGERAQFRAGRDVRAG